MALLSAVITPLCDALSAFPLLIVTVIDWPPVLHSPEVSVTGPGAHCVCANAPDQMQALTHTTNGRNTKRGRR